MLVTILDNGLRSHGEHSYAIIRALKEELKHQSIDTAIYGFREVLPLVERELECVPHFTHFLYDGISMTPNERRLRQLLVWAARTEMSFEPSERECARVLNASFFLDLQALPLKIWAKGNVVLLQGLMQHQLLGLAQFLAAERPKIEAKIICQLMYEPSWLPWGSRPARTGRSLVIHSDKAS